MKGSRPLPCHGFSLTMTDEDQAVMFGGRTPSGFSSEAHVLHLPTMVSWNVRELVKSISRERKLVQVITCSYLADTFVDPLPHLLNWYSVKYVTWFKYNQQS